MGRGGDSENKAKSVARTILENANLLTSNPIEVTDNDSENAANLRKVLLSIAKSKFKNHYGYFFLGPRTRPPGKLIKTLDEFTDCDTHKPENMTDYIESRIFPSNAKLPADMLDDMRAQLMGWAQGLLDKGPTGMWTWEEFQYLEPGKDTQIDAMTVFTIQKVPNGTHFDVTLEEATE
ncbi:hypothetical protein FGG08_002520 [Glutinoglossum americanum]|uniref:Uncharacterized protein n=1 Tax=Glutinoglossum americanum TaxID=1670608 RepID=A0A9P8IBJ7_9PEZI|nr:hypothetical protein FGG08_002520 [Glutinoglossum americanum]